MGFEIQRAMKSRETETPCNQRQPLGDFNGRRAMFLDEPSIKELLLRMVGKMTANFALRDDLLQEAFIHLWRMETRRPGQTKSWYLQSCKFHLSHYLASGCSVDSIKRSRGHSRYDEDSEEPAGFPEMVESDNSVMSQVIARDWISVLSPNLRPGELAVLHSLADGLGAREIARRLKMSHTMVLRCRGKIKSLLVRVERPPILSQHLGHARRNGNRNQANGFGHPNQARAARPVEAPMVLNQPSHTNGTTRHRVIPAGTIPPGQANGFFEAARKLNRLATSGQAVA